MAKPRGIVDDIIRLGEEGQTPKEISITLDCGLSNVYRVLDKYAVDYKRTKKPLTEQEKAEILNLRRAKWSYEKIAKKHGRCEDFIKRICLDSGLSVDLISLGNQYTNGSFNRIENAKRYIRERTPGFEYAGNFTGIDGHVDLKCKTCGSVITRSFVTVKHGKVGCDVCRKHNNETRAKERQKEYEKLKEVQKKRKEQKKKAHEEQRKRQAEERERERLKKIHPCEVCGTLTIRPKYCSSKCAKRVESKRRETKRRLKIAEQMVDRDISLEKLFDRDKGICHICGLACSWEDYTIVNGQKQCSEYYPSIDHVIPLAKGGKHSWDNVKLAHRKCNSFKSDALL